MCYDRTAAFYDRFMAPLESGFLRNWRKETISHIPENSAILEIGAGTGLNFEHYPPCLHSVAFDSSFEMLALAKNRIDTIKLVQTDAQQLPFPDNYFDAAFTTLVFCSIPDPAAAFTELRRVVKPNGKIVLLEHVRPKGVLGYFFDAFNLATVALIDDHFNRRTAETASNSGLKVLDVKSKAFGVVNLILCENTPSDR